MSTERGSVATLRGVGVVRDGSWLLRDLDLDVDGHLVVLGPNGAGKTTLLRLLSTYEYPSRGTVDVLGERFGRVDLRLLRSRIGLVSSGMARLLSRRTTALDLVAAARHGATRSVPLDAADRAAAAEALARIGAAALADRVVATLSAGEWQRVQVARALVTAPELLLLDEPFVGLDLAGRERFVQDLDDLLADDRGPTVVLVTHHLEEIPPGIPTAALLRDGALVAHGPTTTVLVDEQVSQAFGIDVSVRHDDGRFRAVARR